MTITLKGNNSYKNQNVSYEVQVIDIYPVKLLLYPAERITTINKKNHDIVRSVYLVYALDFGVVQSATIEKIFEWITCVGKKITINSTDYSIMFPNDKIELEWINNAVLAKRIVLDIIFTNNAYLAI